MISTFKLKFGRATGLPGEAVSATPMTIFVGPNNSGKSKALREIEHYCRTGHGQATDVILDTVTFSGLSLQEADSALTRLIQPPNQGESLNAGNVIVGSRQGRMQIQPDRFKAAVQNPAANLPLFCQWYLAHRTLRLDGKNRLALVDSQPGGDLQRPGHSTFQVLFNDDETRNEVRRIVYDAFGSYFVIDPTDLGKLRIRLSSRAPASNLEERGIHADAVRFHREALTVDEASDGVKAFIGIVTELLAGDPQILLIDEPEAFLHPSLSSKLGQEVARAALRANKRVFVATHSPQFVMGCIQSGVPLNVIRLTYRSGQSTARLLPSPAILPLMRNPLLRSTNVIGGLFYEFVVVTESDSDRAFYQEINERLLRGRPNWGIPNCLFLNAQNKQTIHTVLKPLRQLGIPAVAIVDVDVIKEGGSVWSALLSGAGIPEISLQALATLRSAINLAMNNTSMDMKRDGGVEILQPPEREAALNLFQQLADYGIFVVSGGELESWLTALGATGHGPQWLISIFEKMGDEPGAVGYVEPADDDVWAFVGRVASWLTDANRKGIPA